MYIAVTSILQPKNLLFFLLSLLHEIKYTTVLSLPQQIQIEYHGRDLIAPYKICEKVAVFIAQEKFVCIPVYSLFHLIQYISVPALMPPIIFVYHSDVSCTQCKVFVTVQSQLQRIQFISVISLLHQVQCVY